MGIKAKSKRRRTLRDPAILLTRMRDGLSFLEAFAPGKGVDALAGYWRSAAPGFESAVARGQLRRDDHGLLEQAVRDVEMLAGGAAIAAWASGPKAEPIH